MSEQEHLPQRPTWRCRTCGDPWPCETARHALIAESGPTALAVLMCSYLGDAAGDLSDVTPVELYARFLSWTRG